MSKPPGARTTPTLAPRKGLGKARQRKLDEHKLDARPTFDQPGPGLVARLRIRAIEPREADSRPSPHPRAENQLDSLGGWRIFKRSIRPDRPRRRYYGTRAGHAGDGRGGGASFQGGSAGQSNRITRWSVLAMQSATSRDQEQGRDNRRQAECPFHQPTPP